MFFGNKGETAADASTPADRIVPLHYFDDAPLWRAFLLYSLFVFDQVLDHELLHSSLENLAQKEGWWKLGARLRYNQKSGALEYHIPAAFTASRPAISYSHAKHDTPASADPLASQLPKPNPTRPSIVGDPDVFNPLMRPPNSPEKLSDYTSSDIPQLGLHIVSFTDKTLVTIYWPHTLMDAMGKKALLDAWCLMLQGREDEVAIPYGTESDPLETLGVNPEEPHKMKSHQMGLWSLLGYAIRQIPHLLWSPGLETRMLYIPAPFLRELHQQAMDSLPTTFSPPGNEGTTKPFLSEGDILCAWWTRLATAHLVLPNTSPSTNNSNNDQTILLNITFNIRPVISIPTPYISNAISFLPVLVPLSAVHSTPLSATATRIRAAIRDLGTKNQVSAFWSLLRGSRFKIPPFFGDAGMHMLTFSNWHKARLFDVDFGCAVVGEGGEGGGGGTDVEDGQGGRVEARPVYIQNNQPGLTLPNGFPILGKDAGGNYWMSGYMQKGLWAGIERMLERGDW